MQKKITVFLAALLVILIGWAIFLAIQPAAAECVNGNAVNIVYTRMTDEELFGMVDVPDNGQKYYARIIYYFPEGKYFVLSVPIENGIFHVSIFCLAEYVTISIVDSPAASLEAVEYDTVSFRYYLPFFDGW